MFASKLQFPFRQNSHLGRRIREAGPSTWRACAAFVLCVGVVSAGETAKPRVDFDRDVRPILSSNCFHCHGPDAQTRQADLRLDTKTGVFDERKDAPVIAPGKPDKSELLRRISAKDADVRMPPADSKRELTPQQIDVIRRWIAQGAEWDEHWSFEPPQRPQPPAVRDRGRVQNPIDAFVVSRLESEGAALSPPARKETLLRRVTLDLTGVPPTIDEIDAFLRDDSPDAYEKVVDRLLASPAYGERTAWDWLDYARYADTNGFQGDPERTMWPWRDWMVQALNANKPFDEFTVELLAGDLIPDATLSQKIASGFNRNHMINGEGGRIAEETRVENVFDRAETTATVWLGVTLTCCRCHDHKYDPISQQEYYSFYAFFNNTSEDGRGRSGAAAPTVNYGPPDAKRQIAELNPAVAKLESRAGKLERSLPDENAPSESGKPTEAARKSVQKLLKKKPAQRDVKELQTIAAFFRQSAPEYAKTLAELASLRSRRDAARKRFVPVMVMDARPKPRPTFILERGTYNKPKEKVAAETPAFLPPLPADAPRNRLTLAKWLVDPRHPLTARVTVNRYWQQFFGAGLVESTEDFGVQGDKPSHPELLDWLAVEFVDSGWNVKHMHRLIVTSATYRQSSSANASTAERSQRDPANRLLSRFPRYRLPSWMLRDQALAVAGLSNRKFGGESVKPYQPPGVWAEATFGKKRYRQDRGNKLYRRSLYVFWRRIVGPTMFFDTSARQTCDVKPSRTNTPLHALTTLNDATYVEAARVAAQRVVHERETPAEQITLAFRRATSRRPTAEELQILSRRLETLRKTFRESPDEAAELLSVGEFPRDETLSPADHAAFTALFTLLLNLDETLSKE